MSVQYNDFNFSVRTRTCEKRISGSSLYAVIHKWCDHYNTSATGSMPHRMVVVLRLYAILFGKIETFLIFKEANKGIPFCIKVRCELLNSEFYLHVVLR